jgi:hypothetical protein
MRISQSEFLRIYGVEAPAGRYRVTATEAEYVVFSVQDDTEGCPLLGNIRTTTGIANCRGANERLMNLLESCEAAGETVWLEVR